MQSIDLSISPLDKFQRLFGMGFTGFTVRLMGTGIPGCVVPLEASIYMGQFHTVSGSCCLQQSEVIMNRYSKTM